VALHARANGLQQLLMLRVRTQVLGHESAGIVTAVGSGVRTHKVGDRVALEPGVPCFSCDVCKGEHCWRALSLEPLLTLYPHSAGN
jgi:threonine dehydrogenase-like Zn-dependent dehydrogenase